MGFVFTSEDNHVSNMLWAVTSGVGSGICFLVLSIIAISMLHPASKHQLDRVSFRIMIYALLANMIFGIASTINALQTAGGFSCAFFMWLLMVLFIRVVFRIALNGLLSQLTLELSTFFLFCIALNLQCVGASTWREWTDDGEILRVLAALAITIPPYASRQYGWDPLNEACWYTSDMTSVRLRWQVGTQVFWSLSCALGEIVMFFTVLTYMLRHQVLHGKAVRSRSRSIGTRSRAASISTTTNGKVPQTMGHAQMYQSVIARISLYPLASLIINTLTVASDLYQTTSNGVKTETDYRILLLNDFCYGGRPLVYALLAATDPSLVRALQSLWRHVRGRKDDTTGDSSGPATTSARGGTSHGQITVHIELNEVRRLDDGTEVGSPPAPNPIALKRMPGESTTDSIHEDSELKNEDSDDSLPGGDSRAARLEHLQRAQIGRAMELRQGTIERKQERKEFKKQI
ncbi:hypothetical protein BT96DRAFT_1021626 [Gymnopus androsaceus JB14]|uniref:G-protein coupled receptors family 1 profile domain-containing protein n=1 Tax=Gymnopus androsaceus JB14 TaxID=1447944 RepID=A0A6A4HCC6_9AGAR|nr:hypothetical protein BT96DRAFT_1021626 [Gymnopus androsaceus JB14]